MKAAAALLLAVVVATPAHADVVVRNSSGGLMISFAIKVNAANDSGEAVRITGRCDSACTLYLAANRLCVTSQARFGFHLPYGASHRANGIAAAYMMRLYPGWVRSWIASRGGLSGKIIHMDYSYASKHVRTCK